jgi:hypothetical protein
MTTASAAFRPLYLLSTTRFDAIASVGNTRHEQAFVYGGSRVIGLLSHAKPHRGSNDSVFYGRRRHLFGLCARCCRSR